jgi:hypothetical protein
MSHSCFRSSSGNACGPQRLARARRVASYHVLAALSLSEVPSGIRSPMVPAHAQNASSERSSLIRPYHWSVRQRPPSTLIPDDKPDRFFTVIENYSWPTKMDEPRYGFKFCVLSRLSFRQPRLVPNPPRRPLYTALYVLWATVVIGREPKRKVIHRIGYL